MITFKAKATDGEIIRSVFQPFTFPAGEAHVKIETRRTHERVEIAIVQPDAKSLHDDLMMLSMWANAITHTAPGIKTVVIMPYFPGARADRGVPFGAEVYAEHIYNLMVSQVIFYDPHSPVIVEQLKHDPGLKVTPVYPHEILGTTASKLVLPNVYDGIIAPDAGAKVRAGAVAREFGIPLFTATKTRDFETGKLTGFGMEDKLDENADAGGTYLIVDDICDGGGTFMGLAQHLKENHDLRLDLYVSHGVFSKNALTDLPKYFDEVFTTNSYAPQRPLNPADNHDVFRVIDVIRPLLDRIDV